MRTNIVYGISYPKLMLGTDKNLAFLIVFADVILTWMTFDWKMGAGCIAVSYVALRFAQANTQRDAWWFKLYKPYNRYGDIYTPWPSRQLSERFDRPYGFGRNSKL